MTDIPTSEITALEKQANPLVTQANSYLIKSEGDVEKASEFLKKVNNTLRSVEAKRQEFVRPLNESLRAINSTFKKIKEPLETAKQTVSERVLVWREIEMERIRKEEERRRKIQEAHVEQGHEARTKIEMARPDKTIGNAQVRKVWTWEIEDFNLVPDEYKMINRGAVTASVGAGRREIPGIKVYQKSTMAVLS